MIDAPSSTWFTASPHWHWLIVVYFVLGALAGGTYFLSAMIDLAGRQGDRQVARLGYFITLPLLLAIAVVLIVDLSRPDRFWHLFVENHTLRPMFKAWVPMSTGVWAMPAFGIFALLSAIAAFAEQRRPQWHFAQRLRPPGLLGMVVAVLGALFALHITGYTGVMLSVLDRPIWSDTALMGLLFIVSAVTMAAALLALSARWSGGETPTVAALHRIWVWLLVVQLAVLIGLFLSLGPAVRGWLNVWGVVLAIGLMVGLVLPLLSAYRNRPLERAGLSSSAACVLVGGILVRTAVVFVPEAITP